VRATQLNVEMLEAAIRAARFEEQIAGEVAGRREELERRSAQAAEAGDAETVLEAERDIALLPTLESRLKAQADTAAARASELNDEAAKVETKADEIRTNAVAPPEREHLWVGPARCRGDALRAIQQTPDFHRQDPAAAAATFEREVKARRSALMDQAHATALALLDEVSQLVAPVRDAALAEAAPNGSLRWYASGSPLTPGKPRVFPGARTELGRAISEYRARAGGETPACTHLATSQNFEFAQDVVDAATSAIDELVQERMALDATLEAHRRRAGLGEQAHSEAALG
jgi:hypothetical protein